MVGPFERVALGVASTMILAGALALTACSSTSGGGGNPAHDASASTGDAAAGDGSASHADAGSLSPCGPDGVYGTFRISGELDGTESICGLSLGSFDGGTLTIAEAPGSGATVSVSASGAGHVDISDCVATVLGCSVTASMCPGSTDTQATVSLDLTVDGTTLSGTSQLGFNGCQAPGLSFTGTH